ncbi:MAG TPA: beta-galactosidase [Aggregatilineales bacterium]|nr:beta-galactosidase [Aggregatilineales bacterium]
MTLHPATLQGTYFCASGKPFIPIGAHWLPARTQHQWNLRWDETAIEADFAKMQELGLNTVRFDLFWAWFEPRPNQYNEEAFRQLDFLVRLAHKYDIYLHPTLFIGGETGEAYWDVPWRQGRHPHADPEMLRLQTDHAAEFGRRYRAEPGILAWDLTDEPPYWIAVDSTTDAMAINWTRLIAGAIRRYDPGRLLCVGTSQEDLNHGPFRPDNLAAEVDFFSVHPYSIYAPDLFPDPMLSERGTYGSAFQVTLSSGAGRPAMVHELGASAAQYTPELTGHFDRVSLYSALGAGANGFLLWVYADAAPEVFEQAPFLRSPHETQFGLTTWDGQDRPAGKVLREFSHLLARLDLTGLAPAPADAAVIIPYEWAKPFGNQARLGLGAPSLIPYVSTQEGGAVAGSQAPRPYAGHEENSWLIRSVLTSFLLARRAGLKAELPREYSDWQNSPLLLLPAPLTSTGRITAHVHTGFWQTVREYVAQGGTVYASFCADAAVPEMGELFGASLRDHEPVEAPILTITAPFGDLNVGETFPYPAHLHNPRHWAATFDLRGGEVIGVDQDGRPALIAHSYGKGKTLICAYPIESYLGAQPSAFERPEQTHRIYRALCQWAGIEPQAATDQPSVEAALLRGDKRGYAVLANHSGQNQRVTLFPRDRLTSAALITVDSTRALALEGNRLTLDIPAYDGAVVDLRML